MAAIIVVAHTGCFTPSAPPVLLYLPLQLSGVPAATPAGQASGPTYQLMLPLRLPDYVDRSEVLVPRAATLMPLTGYRWAEPLREAIPRLLRADLAALLGPGRVWSVPLPPGVLPQRQWRVELVEIGVDPVLGAVRLQAQWSLAHLAAATALRSETLRVEIPLASADAVAIAEAHRRAVGELARALVERAR